MDETLLTFPCDFPIKVMGPAHDDFVVTVVSVVRTHAPGLDETRLEVRSSAGGKYTSLTCTITAESKHQLDTIYRALTSHPMVKVVL